MMTATLEVETLTERYGGPMAIIEGAIEPETSDSELPFGGYQLDGPTPPALPPATAAAPNDELQAALDRVLG